jgi:hypothetical protein
MSLRRKARIPPLLLKLRLIPQRRPYARKELRRHTRLHDLIRAELIVPHEQRQEVDALWKRKYAVAVVGLLKRGQAAEQEAGDAAGVYGDALIDDFVRDSFDAAG